MGSLLRQVKNNSNKASVLKKQALDFISAGVGCNCLIALHEAGVLEELLKNGYINAAEIENYGNAICLRSALVTLERCKILTKNGNNFEITPFGRTLLEYLGLITIFFDGYMMLISHQAQIAKNKKINHDKLINWPAIAKSSTYISEKMVTPIIIQELSKLRISGTICDLGCGCGTMLSKICESTRNSGLGFESASQTVKEANQYCSSNVTIEVEDITAIQGIWEDVVVLIQAFVFHDFYPKDACTSLMDSYLNNFPNLRYFLYIDIVSPSKASNQLFPGFDYVHGLLGAPTRTYEETLDMLFQSNYKILKEVTIPFLPNTFLWILSPKKKADVKPVKQ